MEGDLAMKLSPLQNRYLDLLLAGGVLKFGSFKTKSGRLSPFFLNSGAFDHGSILREVAKCYSERVVEFAAHQGVSDIHLYGPAYKGITLAAATAIEVALITGREVPFTFNRKEAKDHGEGGRFVGREISPGVSLFIIEDVMTGGTSIRETMDILAPTGAKVRGVFIGVDRLELGADNVRASSEVQLRYNFPVISILTIDEIVDALWRNGAAVERLGRVWITAQIKSEIERYRSEWGGLKS